jgi:hypothetical protein
MLVITRTMHYGDEESIYLFNHYLFWTKKTKEKDRLVMLEFKGNAKDFEHLVADNPTEFKLEGEGARATYRYVGTAIRTPTLEDIIKADVYTTWGLQEGDFTLQEYKEFLEVHFPAYIERLATIVKASGDDRMAPMKEMMSFLERFQHIMYGVQTENQREYNEIREKAELRIIDASKDLPWNELLRIAAGMEVYEPQRHAAILAFRKLFKEEKDHSAALWKAIMMAKEDQRISGILNQIYADPDIVVMVRHALKFPQNYKGQTIELQNMVESDEASFGAHLATAKFVGPVRIGKKFLWDAEKNLYLFGSKKLKHNVMARGGKVQKYGNTLVMTKADVDTDLLIIRKIDAYAVLNPAMVATIKNRKGKSFKVDKKYIQRIKKDYRVGRELADTALEELFGIDPDIARRLYRSKKDR